MEALCLNSRLRAPDSVCHTMKARLDVEKRDSAVRYFLANSSAGLHSSRRA